MNREGRGQTVFICMMFYIEDMKSVEKTFRTKIKFIMMAGKITR